MQIPEADNEIFMVIDSFIFYVKLEKHVSKGSIQQYGNIHLESFDSATGFKKSVHASCSLITWD